METSACGYAKLLQLCPTLCNPMDYSLPGSPVYGILQARFLEWVAIVLLQGLFLIQGVNPRLLWLLHCKRILYWWATEEASENRKDANSHFFCFLFFREKNGAGGIVFPDFRLYYNAMVIWKYSLTIKQTHRPVE